jgi:enoyl-CoA hydratase
VDLRRVVDEPPEYVLRLIAALRESFEGLFSFPKPTVAAVNGPAIAGGCIVACACDRRIAAEGARIGASELVVGVSFPASAIEILRSACPERVDDVILGAGIFDAHEAEAIGLVHEVVAPEALVERAVEVAGSLGSFQPDAYRLAKEQLRRPALDQMRAGAAEMDASVANQWAMADTRARISEQLDRLTKK